MIVKSLLDTDLYKLTMGQCAFHQFPEHQVVYEFKCRNKDIDFSNCIDNIIKELNDWFNLKFNLKEIEYLKSLNIFKSGYLDFLYSLDLSKFRHCVFSNHFKYDKIENKFKKIFNKDKELKITIIGSWFITILFEVPFLAIINECYFNKKDFILAENAIKILDEKINFVKNNIDANFKFVDFGTRRRRSCEWQEYVISKLKIELPENFIGTSNIYFAKLNNINPIGTMAHEFIQSFQFLKENLIYSQRFAMLSWLKEYDNKLGIILSDTYGMKAFFKDFQYFIAKDYEGVRQDSGDPFVFCEKLISHYKSLGIDSKTKKIVFSDNLNFELAKELYDRFKDEINVSFGIGTNLTNDFGDEPLNIVIKMVKCNGQSVAKISDSEGKEICEDKEYLEKLKKLIE